MDLETVLTSLAEGVRERRTAAGLTLEQLAQRAELSTAHLSRIESGDRQPSLGALISLARALGISVGTLLGETEEGGALAVYDGDQPTRTVNGLTVATAGGFPGSSALTALRVSIDPDRRPPEPARHRGEEWIYVLRGRLRLDYDGTLERLGPGSAAHFDADRPHRLAAERVTTELLVVVAEARTPFPPPPFPGIADH